MNTATDQPAPAKLSERRTVAQVLNYVPGGGRSMDIFLTRLTHNLQAHNWDTLFVFAGEPQNDFASQLRALQTSWIVEKFPLGAQTTIKLGQRLFDHQCDVLQTHFMSSFDPCIRRLKRAAGVRHLIVTDHSSGKASPKNGLKTLLAQLRGAMVGSRLDQLVAVSDYVRLRDIHQVFLPAAKIRRIYNGVDVIRYSPPAPTSPTQHQLTVAYAGQLIAEKGVLVLLQAIDLIANRYRGRLKVLIAGRGSQHAELIRFCTSRGMDYVQFTGHIDWVPKLMSSADVVVVPSVWEDACPFSTIEAMACGACLLVSDAGGIPEIVGRDGTSGLLFRKSDVTHLTENLVRLLEDAPLRQQMRLAARARAVEHFTVERMVAEYTALFDQIQRSGKPCRRR